MKVLATVLTALALVSKTYADDGHDHSNEHKCACEAEEFGYEINCANTDAMIEAMNNLQSLGCSADCSSPECEKNFLIVVTHHDYCPEADIPELVEDGFHDYDEVCIHCAISRKSIEGAEPCPPATCDNSGNEAYAAAISAGCLDDCSSDECKNAFFTLSTVHDNCDHDVISQAAEEGLHDLEESCPQHVCDTGVEDQLVCDEDHEDHEDEKEDDHDHDHDHDEDKEMSSSAARKSMIAGAAAVLAFMA